MKSRCYHPPFILPGLEKGDTLGFTELSYLVCCPLYEKTAATYNAIKELFTDGLMESKAAFFHKWGEKMTWHAVATHLVHWGGGEDRCQHQWL